MVEALADAGHDTHLLTYAHGHSHERRDLADGVTHRRLADSPRARSLRSGPSFAKVALDLQMVGVARRLAARLSPSLVIAHGVEAAHVARLARLSTIAPTIYYAHTRFDAELPTYLRSQPSSRSRSWRSTTLETLGRALDLSACALPSVAITPDLAAHLHRTQATRRSVDTLLPPWAPLDPPRPEERIDARDSLAIAPDARVVLYAGNLDGYQGWEEAADAARRTRTTFLVATESDPPPLAPFPHVHVRLASEHDRRRAYAACDLVVVPRRAPGGLPIKLLDALARDVPVVAGPRALAGLDPHGVERADTDEAPALAAAIERAFTRRPRGGRVWIEDTLAPARFVASIASLARTLSITSSVASVTQRARTRA